MWGCAIVDNFVDKNYPLLIKEIVAGRFFGLMPDFSLSCFEASRELVFDRLTGMANSFIEHSRKAGKEINAPTSESVLRDKWDGFEIVFLTFRV